MNSQNKPIRLFPHVSLRTLAIFMTLVGLYFGTWEGSDEMECAEHGQ